MVALPLLPERVVTSDAPRSSVSRADIISQGNDTARALTGVSDALMSVATTQAKEQAANELQDQKITRDADGTVSVANPAGGSLIFGAAGEAYNEAVKVGTIAQHSNVISQELNTLHQKYPADPAGFRAAADAWRDTYLGDHGGGVAGQALSQEIGQLTTQHFNAITNSAARADLATSSSSISALQESARNDALTMARSGVKLDDPAMAEKVNQFDAASQRRRANPLFGYSAEQADLDRKTFASEIQGGNFLHNIDGRYQSDGYAGAAKAAEDILTNRGYALSQQQREAFYHRAMGEIRTNEAMRRQDVAEARAAYRELSLASAGGVRIDSTQVEGIAKKFEAAGDPGGAAMVRSSFMKKPLNDEFGRQPIPVMTDQLAMVHGATAAATAHRFFVSKGYTPEQAAGIVGNLVHESGLDPAAVGDNGTSGGLAQFHNERLTALKKFAADRGKPATDFQTQLEFVDQELNTTEGATRQKLLAAKTPEEAAHAFIDYERPQGWTSQNPAGGLGYNSRLRLARAVFDGKSIPGGTGGPAGTLWLEANRSATLDDAATKQWLTIVKDFHTESIVPSNQRVSELVRAATLTGNTALLDQIAHDSANFDAVRNAAALPIPEQAAAIAEAKARAARGDSDPGVAATIKGLEQRKAAIVKGLDDNPVATTTTNFPTVFKTAEPLNLGNDQVLFTQLAQRAKVADFAARNWQTSPRSALDAADVAQVQAVLASPDPAVKVRIFRALSTLPEDIRGATLAKLGQNGVVASTEAFAGSLISQAPEVAASILTGLRAQDADERLLPTKGPNKLNYQTAKDTALPISAFNVAARSNPTGAYAVMSAAIDARYASLSAQAGDTSGSVNRSRLKQAADDVTGGILYQNGAPLIAPKRGMSQRDFDSILGGLTDNDVAGMQTGSGKPLSADFLRSSGKLHSLASGRYLVQINQDDASPRYAAGADGRPFVLDLRDRSPTAGLASALPTAADLALAP